jgi:hypothetical protein
LINGMISSATPILLAALGVRLICRYLLYRHEGMMLSGTFRSRIYYSSLANWHSFAIWGVGDGVDIHLIRRVLKR